MMPESCEWNISGFGLKNEAKAEKIPIQQNNSCAK